jgi:hypothetical protein
MESSLRSKALLRRSGNVCGMTSSLGGAAFLRDLELTNVVNIRPSYGAESETLIDTRDISGSIVTVGVRAIETQPKAFFAVIQKDGTFRAIDRL